MYDLTWLMMVLRVGAEVSVVNVIGRKYQSMIAAIVLSVLHATPCYTLKIIALWAATARRQLQNYCQAPVADVLSLQ